MWSRASMKNVPLTSYLMATDWMLPPKIKNKARMSIPTASFQWCITFKDLLIWDILNHGTFYFAYLCILSLCLLAICISSFVNYISVVFAHASVGGLALFKLLLWVFYMYSYKFVVCCLFLNAIVLP